MLVSNLRTFTIAGCAFALGLGPSLANATPSEGVHATNLSTGTSADTVMLEQVGATEVTIREITIEPGGSTGWHFHTGELVALVQAGTLTRYLDDCSEVTTAAGEALVEPSGSHHVHFGRNLGTEPLVLYVTYVLQAGSPLSVDAPAPTCGG
jgi:quercetin dioxygenase-like cupin family protein